MLLFEGTWTLWSITWNFDMELQARSQVDLLLTLLDKPTL